MESSSLNDSEIFEKVQLELDAPRENDNSQEGDASTMSKRARKRKLKAENWMKNKRQKRALERQRLKLKSLDARQKGIKLEKANRKALKNAKMSINGLRVVLDFSFDNKMIPKDLHRLVNQTLRVYSANRRVKTPLQVYATSFNGQSSEIISKHDGYSYWDLNFKTEDYMELFKKDELVYLTSDSENVIRELDYKKVYIIGALVDHNSLKGECYQKAVSQGIQHGRLPLDDHVLMKTRKVLTVDQVFHIIALVAGSNYSWEEAILKVMPQRKGAVPKGTITRPSGVVQPSPLNSVIKSSSLTLENYDAAQKRESDISAESNGSDTLETSKPSHCDAEEKMSYSATENEVNAEAVTKTIHNPIAAAMESNEPPDRERPHSAELDETMKNVKSDEKFTRLGVV